MNCCYFAYVGFRDLGGFLFLYSLTCLGSALQASEVRITAEKCQTHFHLIFLSLSSVVLAHPFRGWFCCWDYTSSLKALIIPAGKLSSPSAVFFLHWLWGYHSVFYYTVIFYSHLSSLQNCVLIAEAAFAHLCIPSARPAPGSTA